MPYHKFSQLPLTTLFSSVLMIIMLSACEPAQKTVYKPSFTQHSNQEKTSYIFGVHPLHNPQRLHEVFNPLMDYLSDNIDGVSFQLEASRNYAEFDKKLYSNHFDFSLPNPFQTVNAIDRGYQVFAKMGDDQNFKGIILVRKDSGITQVSDLKGKAVSYPAPTALAATMMPQYYLQTHGINVMTELDNKYVGSQESSVMNVFLGKTAASATWPPPWKSLSQKRPELAEQLHVIWQTEPLLNNGLVVLPSVPQETIDQVTRLILNLHQHAQGRFILARMELSKFETANNMSYNPIKEFITKFSQQVRPVDK